MEESTQADIVSQFTRINLVKLHGSNNFPKRARGRPVVKDAGRRLVEAADDPLILPPVFNKASQSIGAEAWAAALDALRCCKNLIVCGYSLPITDIYMQYFLKAALGPNQNLNKIFVFDPCLFLPERKSDGDALKQRYGSNFAAPIQKRIDYSPPSPQGGFSDTTLGSLAHLVWLLREGPDSILFG